MKSKAFFVTILILLHQNAYAQSSSPDPLARAAIENLHAVDGTGQWFSFSIAAIGALGAISLGSWALTREDVNTEGNINLATLGAGITLIGTGFGQLTHGALRFAQRTTSARTASKLLNDRELIKNAGMLYLENRAHEAHAMRFWGGTLTTLQGLAATTLGIRLLTQSNDEYRTQGYVFTGLGVLITGIGAIHYFGDPHAQRELDATLAKRETQATIQLQPTLMMSRVGNPIPGLALSGSY